MSNYGFAFHSDSRRMSEDGMSASEKTLLYRKVREALNECGFCGHPQQSFYHTRADDAVLSVLTILDAVRRKVPGFAKYVSSAHMFRLEDWSDVTTVFKDQPPRTKGRDDNSCSPSAELTA